MKITHSQLARMIKEELSGLRERSDEFTQATNPQFTPKLLGKIFSSITRKLADIEQAIEMMGGTVISINTRLEDIEVKEGERTLAAERPQANEDN